MLKIFDLQNVKIYLCVSNTIQHTITESSVRGLGAMYRSFNDRPLLLPWMSTELQCSLLFYPKTQRQVSENQWHSRSVYFQFATPLAVVQRCMVLTAVCVSLAPFVVLMMTNRKKRLCQRMFLFNRKLVHVTTVSGKGERNIYPRNNIEDPEGSRDIDVLLSVTSNPDGFEGQRQAPASLLPVPVVQ